YPSLVQMQSDFNTDATTINASVSIYVFCNAVFPLVWAPFGDIFGRRRIYILSFLISMVGSVGCALSTNVGMFIAFRAVSSMGASSVMSMGAGTLSDIYYASERGRAMSIYMAPPLLAPAVGPIIGGYMSASLGWHSVFWFVAIYGLVVWICILFFLPETWRPEKKQELPGNEKPPLTKWQTLKQVNPIHSLRFFRYGNVRLCVTFTGVCFMIFYIFNTSFTRTYTTQYHLESGTVGLCYVPYACGSFLAATVGGRAIDRFYNRSAAKAGGKGKPEMRLNLYFLGFAVFSQVAGELTYGWCTEKNLHMAIGLVCIFFIGFGIMVPNITMSTYSVDCFRSRSASITGMWSF
ncbi:MFS general substrate transporter, partial [Backusella circina FSU 941]